MRKRITLRNGWIVVVDVGRYGYTIEEVYARFSYTQWFKVDTSDWTDEAWNVIHDALEDYF